MSVRMIALVIVSLALSACEGLSFLASNCSSDDQCGADEVCYDGYCALRCSDDTSCPENETCDASGHCVADIVDDPDGGPQPKDAGQEDAGPDALEVTLSADVTTVDRGAAVTLTWSSEPAAESCALFVETPFTSREAVPGAPTTGADALVVNPEQDSEYTIECTLGSDTADASVSVDVNAAGTLSATVTELNPEETTDLSWTANGVTSCELTGPGGFSYAVPSTETPSGSTTVSTPAAGDYALSCDGSSLATVTLEVASVTIDDVFPNALGPSEEVVTLTYTYVGPFPNSCEVRAGTGAAVDADPVEPGHQLPLSETTALTVECEGYGGATLSDDWTVEKLLPTFTGPTSPLDYGAEEALVWTTSDDEVVCTLDGVEVESPHVVTFTASGTLELVCTKGEATTSVTYEAAVRPGIEVVGTLTKENPGVSEADVVLRVLATENTSGCVVDAGHLDGEPVPLVAQEGDLKVFVLTIEAGSVADGEESYVVTCESDPGVEAVGDAVDVWWGELDASGLSDFGASEASLVTGEVDLDGAGAVTELQHLREVGGNLRIEGTTLPRLEGLESLEVVHGTLFVRDNAALEELTGGAVVRGLFALRRVDGSITIGHADDPNLVLSQVSLPALEEIGQGLSITNNGALTTISMGALSSVGQGLSITGNKPGTGVTDLDHIDLRSLVSVGANGGGFTLMDTLLAHFTSLTPQGFAPFGSLTSVGTGAVDEPFHVRFNSALPCEQVLAVYCGLSEPRAQDYLENMNLGECSDTCPH